MNTKRSRKKIFIITGMSGAGKSQALKCFEDLGFYCIDNMPLALIPAFAKLLGEKKYLHDIALGIDIREGRFLKGLEKCIDEFKENKLDYRILFLDASDTALFQRFSETRHKHPLGQNLSKAVRQERKMLRELKARADKAIDTSNLTLGELKEILSAALELKRSSEMKISVVSFGYKYGLPMDADIVMDVRFLPNPYYIKDMKYKTGVDRAVFKHVIRGKTVAGFLTKYLELINILIPLYIREGKSYLTVAIGCTGGKHRSVSVAHYIAVALTSRSFKVSEFHRDISK